MSSLWTPGGERPIRREPDPQPQPTPGPGDGYDVEDEGDFDPAQVQAQLEAMQQVLAEAPAGAIVANQCVQFFQLAQAYLTLQPPHLDGATLAIDAFAAVLDALRGRLGDDEQVLNDALAQIRLAFVQIKAGAGE